LGPRQNLGPRERDMSDLSMHLVPVLPVWAVLLLSAALLAVLAHGCWTLLRRQIPQRPVVVLAVLRIVLTLLFALVLLHPVISWTHSVERRPEMLVLIDVSESMAQPGGTEGNTRLQEVLSALDRNGLARELGKRFELRWFAFDRGATPLEGEQWRSLQPDG